MRSLTDNGGRPEPLTPVHEELFGLVMVFGLQCPFCADLGAKDILALSSTEVLAFCEACVRRAIFSRDQG
jgi:hypothetical protein